ncbi:hypothetical protein K4L06_09980 [Lysobacter sp. BMK333-48F3]|uniref:hypothetical protein n=1 Tax=Lysobacter sp. BMK333-48F3 TaxID=2867962 RepID=UPI001C8C1397|nr:hypothetical protein [Lysobacter sp. BMK333-48F3]MBX9401642.1 hypothetical protein [Lysobacter sp. BMK333-48F3]
MGPAGRALRPARYPDLQQRPAAPADASSAVPEALGRPNPARYHARMSTHRTQDDQDGHVVHLVPRLDAAAPPSAPPPESLRFPRRMGTAGRTGFAFLNLVASAGAAWAIVQLWTDETPGWWFNLIFTVLLACLVLALWAILAGSIRQATLERRLEALWREIGPTAVATAGQVTGRCWVLAEDGSVSSFVLLVRLADGLALQAHWNPDNSRECLLQTQVPGVGAQARVWRVPDAAADAPLVIETADPSVVG